MGDLAPAAGGWDSYNGSYGGLLHLILREGSRGRVIEAFGPLLEAVEREDDTLIYLLFLDEDDADSLWIYRRFRDKAAAETHAVAEITKSVGHAISAHLVESRPQDLVLLAAKGIAPRVPQPGQGA